MKVNLAYGQGLLPVELPEDRTTVITPAPVPGLPNERAAVQRALDHPTGCPPLRDWIEPGCRVCVTFTDITRATPNDRLMPWLLEYLADLPKASVTLLNQNGTHRPNSRLELERMLTPVVVRHYPVLNHDAANDRELVRVGVTRDGTPALINRQVAEADVRIITGFIEPHFFAGFSGGVKGIIPGTAGLATILSNHGAGPISHPQATFGVTEGNPLWEELREIALRLGPSFLLNVTLNEERAITGVFAGDILQAHRQGCAFVRQSAMRRCPAPFDVVVTSNSGYPLDLNLYQGVKGMSAGARILKPGGTLILACECREGLPPGSPMEQILHRASHPAEILVALKSRGSTEPEQWQAQILALILGRAQVLVYSMLPPEAVRAAHLIPCRDISGAVEVELRRRGPSARLAVLPQGPLTIPYLAGADSL